MGSRKPSVVALAFLALLQFAAFVLIFFAIRRRSKGKVVPDRYDESTYCKYDSDIATVYAIAAFFLIATAQTVAMGLTRCLCFTKGLTAGIPRIAATIFFVFSWLIFLVLEASLIAGAAQNAYHTKYRGVFAHKDLSCEMLREGVFVAAAVLTWLHAVLTMAYYSCFIRADSAGWSRYHSETDGVVGMDGVAMSKFSSEP